MTVNGSFLKFSRSWVLIIAACLAALPLNAADIIFNVNNTRHQFAGFGAQMWTGDSRPIAMAPLFNFKYMRVNVNRSTLGFATGTRADYDNFWSSTSSGTLTTLQKTWSSLTALEITPVLIHFGIQDIWLSGDNFQSVYVDEHAKYWGAYVNWLDGYGISPPYIELFNEPDGDWNGYVSASIYNSVVKAVRNELDYRGFYDVKIVGPGRAHIDTGGQDSWIESLDSSGVTAIGAWSIHGWEWYSGKNDPQFVRDSYNAGFGSSVDNKDPLGIRPVFITEYATFADEFHGVSGNLETIPWAVRVFENTLSFLNLGVNVPFYWQAADMNWDVGNHGLIRVDGSKRPVYHALLSLYPKVPVGAYIIEADLQDTDVYSSAFIKDDVLVIAVVNGTAYEQNKNIKINNITGLLITEALSFVGEPAGSEIVTRTLAVNGDNSIDITLPSDTTLTIVCDIDPQQQTEAARVLQWRLEDNTFDISGNENHASVTGTVQYTDGVFGRCMTFNGSSNPTVQNTSAVNIPVNYDDSWSMNLWVQPEVAISSGGTYHGLGLAGFGIGDWDSNQARERTIGNWGWDNKGISFYSIATIPSSTSIAYGTGSWQMITMTFDQDLWFQNPGDNTGDSLKIYKNGLLIGSINPQGEHYTGGFKTAAPIVRLVPETFHIAPNNFTGKLDEFTIWQGVLTYQQINNLLSGPVIGDADGDGLVGIEDLMLLAYHWLEQKYCPEDFNMDGKVDFQDFALMAQNLDFDW